MKMAIGLKACEDILINWYFYLKLTWSLFSLEQVRKEKLGDRIAALQQLVAPFGKVVRYYCSCCWCCSIKFKVIFFLVSLSVNRDHGTHCKNIMIWTIHLICYLLGLYHNFKSQPLVFLWNILIFITSSKPPSTLTFPKPLNWQSPWFDPQPAYIQSHIGAQFFFFFKTLLRLISVS